MSSQETGLDSTSQLGHLSLQMHVHSSVHSFAHAGQAWHFSYQRTFSIFLASANEPKLSPGYESQNPRISKNLELLPNLRAYVPVFRVKLCEAPLELICITQGKRVTGYLPQEIEEGGRPTPSNRRHFCKEVQAGECSSRRLPRIGPSVGYYRDATFDCNTRQDYVAAYPSCPPRCGSKRDRKS